MIKALAIGALLQAVSAVPTAPQNSHRNLKVVKTTKVGDQVIDWVVKDSQGEIATPPPHPPAAKRPKTNDPKIKQAMPILAAQHEAGPPGTVPILRQGKQFPPKRLPQPSDHNVTADLGKRGYAGTHWYASSNQNVQNHGGGAQFNIYDTYLESDYDFSLLQTAVTISSAPQADGSSRGQTVEAGWMHYPYLLGGGPFLFTYYTTNGYTQSGDNKGGYNRLQDGWVQVDKDIYPGIHFSPLSQRGGAQYEFTLQYQLFQGNWWLYAIDRFIGYYPASVFSQGVDPGRTLATHSDVILFYGEVVNSQDGLTTTDMGSGNFPEPGFGQSAYIRNILYIDTNENGRGYDAQGHFVVSDPNRYRFQDHWNSGTDWGSYCFLGGPGAGGVVGG